MAKKTDVVKVEDDAVDLVEKGFAVRNSTDGGEHLSQSYVPVSYEDALADIAAFTGGEIIEFQGSPYEVVDKESLIDIPMVVLDYKFTPGKFGEDFVSVVAITENDKRVVFNDGGTGVRAQFEHMATQNPRRFGIHLPNGLRKSTYPIDKDGSPVPYGSPDAAAEASTYYVA
jgi:hypothetical protein